MVIPKTTASKDPRYTPEQVQSYIDRTYLRVSECQQIDSRAPQQALSSSGDSNSAATISSARIQSISASGMLADMTQELAKSAAEVLQHGPPILHMVAM
jgi:hypothetical protein